METIDMWNFVKVADKHFIFYDNYDTNLIPITFSWNIVMRQIITILLILFQIFLFFFAYYYFFVNIKH